MSHKHYQSKVEELESTIQNDFLFLINQYGEPSSEYDLQVLKVNNDDVPAECHINIVEIYNNGFIDNDGLQYSFYTVSLNVLAELIDNIKNRNFNK